MTRHCPRCSNAVELKQLGAVPMYKCTGCGKDQLRSSNEVQKHTSHAIASLNDAAGFPHSG